MKQRWFAVEWKEKVVRSCDWDESTESYFWCHSMNGVLLEYMKCAEKFCYVQFREKVSVGEAESAFKGMMRVKGCTKSFVDSIEGDHTHGQIRSSGAVVRSKIKLIPFYDVDYNDKGESFKDFPVINIATGSPSYLILLSADNDIDTCKTFKDADVKLSKCSGQIVYVYLEKYATLETVRKWYGSPYTTIMICSKRYCEAFFSTRSHHTHDIDAFQSTIHRC